MELQMDRSPSSTSNAATLHTRRVFALVGGLAILAVAALASLAIGSRPVPPATVIAALFGDDVPRADAHAVLDLRVPRTALAILVGGALAAAGALIQTLTRNPLADPGILGVTSGSSFAVALAVGLLGITRPSLYVWFALAGALAATLAVALVGGAARGSVDPVRLLLAGVALGAVLSGIVSGLRIASPRTFNTIKVWEAGTFVDRSLTSCLPVVLIMLTGAVIALALGKSLNTLALGEDMASALGTSVWRTRLLAVAAITFLAGGATALAGPISFVGLMVPHVARWLTGQDQRWIMACCLIWGPIITILADIAARIAVSPGEMPVGIVLSFLGGPVLVALVRRRKALAL